MITLATVSTKGGVGKSTTSFNLAAILGEKDRVLLVDADPQASAAWMIGKTDQELSFDTAQETNPRRLARLRHLQDYDWVIVDTPPARDALTIQAVLGAADKIIIPTPPAPLDLTSALRTAKTIPPEIPFRVLITKVDPRSMREAREVQQHMLRAKVPIFTTVIRLYKAYERTALAGLPITTWSGPYQFSAANDYRRMAEEVRQWPN